MAPSALPGSPLLNRRGLDANLRRYQMPPRASSHIYHIFTTRIVKGRLNEIDPFGKVFAG